MHATRRALLLASLGVAALALGAAAPAPARRPHVPAIVFASRRPPLDRAIVPGLGPIGRAIAPGGTLQVREPDGRVRALLPAGALWDVSDPSVSFDARTVAFAGTVAADSAWRIWTVRLDGGGLARVTNDDPTRPGERVDDFDPCWIAARTLVFASTRYPQRAQYADLPVTNLYRLDLDDHAPRRLTSERNGAEEPAWDATRGRVIFSRWWFNRWHAADAGAGELAASATPGLAAVAPHTPAADAINVWHVMSIGPDGRGERVEAGSFADRRGAMGTQPAVLADGRIVAVVARNLGLEPAPGALALQSMDRAFGASRRVAGAALDAADSSAYGSVRGLAPPAACSPAALPDGRVVFAFDASGRGDFGLAVADADGAHRATLLDLPGTLELDPTPVVRRESRPIAPPPAPRRDRPATRVEELRAPVSTFRYANADVFAGAGGPARISSARLRFFAVLARAITGGDTAVLVREVSVARDGRVDERSLPADVPMFEQLVDAHGAALRTPRGPAHVAGLNIAAPGATARCVGCHVGHSTGGR